MGRIENRGTRENMAMRELVTGGAACAVPGSSSSSNPLGALANALIGSSSKTQVLFPLQFLFFFSFNYLISGLWIYELLSVATQL